MGNVCAGVIQHGCRIAVRARQPRPPLPRQDVRDDGDHREDDEARQEDPVELLGFTFRQPRRRPPSTQVIGMEIPSVVPCGRYRAPPARQGWPRASPPRPNIRPAGPDGCCCPMARYPKAAPNDMPRNADCGEPPAAHAGCPSVSAASERITRSAVTRSSPAWRASCSTRSRSRFAADIRTRNGSVSR